MNNLGQPKGEGSTVAQLQGMLRRTIQAGYDDSMMAIIANLNLDRIVAERGEWSQLPVKVLRFNEVLTDEDIDTLCSLA